MNQRLKDLIFKKLNEDLSKMEIIPYKDSIWFIDREKKYWYFEYEKSGTLYWRWDFFPKFFHLFSMERDEFEPIISEWVEDVLNCKIDIHGGNRLLGLEEINEVLNCKVNAPKRLIAHSTLLVEEVLNCKVEKSMSSVVPLPVLAEQALNYKVEKSIKCRKSSEEEVKEVLEHKVKSIDPAAGIPKGLMERIKKILVL